MLCRRFGRQPLETPHSALSLTSNAFFGGTGQCPRGHKCHTGKDRMILSFVPRIHPTV